MIFGTINTDDVVMIRRVGKYIETLNNNGEYASVISSVAFGDIVYWARGFVSVSTTCIVASRALVMFHKGGWASVRGCPEMVRVTKKFEATVSKHDPMDDTRDYRLGFKAKIGGWSKAVCPFKKSQPGYAKWCEGWDDGPSAPWNK